MSMRVQCLCVALVGALGLSAALAKPPDLPVNGKVDCKETPKIAVAEEQEPAAKPVNEAVPIDALTPWVCEWFTGCLCDAFDWFGREPESATPLVMPHVRRLITVDGEVIERLGIEFEPKAADGSTCPFLQRAQPAPNGPKPEAFADGVLANLEKLELAQEMFKLAERYRSAGKALSAELCFAQVQALCPGSQWDVRAGERRRELATARDNTGQPVYTIELEELAAEEQELTTVPKKRELQQALRSLVEAVQKGMDLDVELSPRARVRCELHVGGVMYKVTVDDNGTVHCLRQSLTNR